MIKKSKRYTQHHQTKPGTVKIQRIKKISFPPKKTQLQNLMPKFKESDKHKADKTH